MKLHIGIHWNEIKEKGRKEGEGKMGTRSICLDVLPGRLLLAVRETDVSQQRKN